MARRGVARRGEAWRGVARRGVEAKGWRGGERQVGRREHVYYHLQKYAPVFCFPDEVGCVSGEWRSILSVR